MTEAEFKKFFSTLSDEQKNNFETLANRESDSSFISFIEEVAKEMIEEINLPTSTTEKIQSINESMDLLCMQTLVMNTLNDYRKYRNSKSHN